MSCNRCWEPGVRKLPATRVAVDDVKQPLLKRPFESTPRSELRPGGWHVCVCVSLSDAICVCVRARARARDCGCACMCVCVCASVRDWSCLCVCVCVCVCVHARASACVHARSCVSDGGNICSFQHWYMSPISCKHNSSTSQPSSKPLLLSSAWPL